MLSQNKDGTLLWQETIEMGDDDDSPIIDVENEPPKKPEIHEYKIGL